ncbi:MAG: WD40 repeat domain-containing protein [Desulfococcaceae bacterium]
MWDRPRIEREIRRRQCHSTLLDALEDMERFVNAELPALSRNGDLPGFVRRHARDCGAEGGLAEIFPAVSAPLFRQVYDRPDNRAFPALLGVLPNPKGGADRAAATPDGRWLATVEPGGEVVLRGGETGEIRKRLKSDLQRVLGVDLSADGRWLVFGGVGPAGGRVEAWNAAEGVRVFSARGSGVCRISGNGNRLLWQGADGRLLRRTLSSDETPRVLWASEQTDRPVALAISGDGRVAVSAPRNEGIRNKNFFGPPESAGQRSPAAETFDARKSSGGTPASRETEPRPLRPFLQVWDLETGQCRHRIPLPGGGAKVLTLTPDGRKALCLGEDGTVRIWDCRSGRIASELPSTREPATALAAAPGGRMVFTAHGMGLLQIWDIRKGRAVKTLRSHYGTTRRILPTHDGRRAFALGGDGVIRRLDLQRGEPEEPAVHRSIQLANTSPDGRFVLAAGCLRNHRKEIRIWDLATGFPAGRRIDPFVLPFRNIGLSPRENLVLIVRARRVQGWRYPGNAMEFQWEFPETERIERGDFAADGQRVALLTRENFLLTGPLGGRRPSILTGDVRAHAPFPDDRHILVLTGGRGVEIWDLLRRVSAARLPDTQEVQRMTPSPDGRHLLEFHRRGLLRIRNLQTGRMAFSLGFPLGCPPEAAFSPDGRRVTIAAEKRKDGEAARSRILSLNLSEGAKSRLDGPSIPLPFHRPILRITPDGRGLAAAESGGREILLLDLDRGERVGCFHLPSESAPLTHMAAFGKNGALPVALQDGGVIFLGVGGGYEKTVPVSPARAEEILFRNNERRARSWGSVKELETCGGKNSPSVSIRRPSRPQSRKPVIHLSPELRAAILSG